MMQLGMCGSAQESSGGIQLRGSNGAALPNAKFEFRKTSLGMGEGKVPNWEFLDCHDELITFAEKDRKRYSLGEKSSNCVV